VSEPRGAERPELTVVMPVYNEMARIETALSRLFAADLDLDWELLVVDDGSTDGTREFLQAHDWPPNARLVLHERNRGKGAAVRTGLAEARGELTTIFDADLEYDPGDIAQVVAPIRRGEATAVFGVRAFEGHTSHSFLYVLGNRGVTLVANVLFNVYMRDLMTCHKAVRTDIFRSLPLRADGFEIEPEIAARLIQHGERIYEVAVEYRARGSDEGKKLTASDGLRVVATLLRCRLTS
jgi:glycosyltransferase involved in cell wall biosynthesis